MSLFSILCTGTHELLLLLRIPVQAASAFAFCPHATPFPQPCKFSYKNSNSLLGYQPNTARDYFFLPHPVYLCMYACVFMFVLLGKNIGRQTATRIHEQEA